MPVNIPKELRTYIENAGQDLQPRDTIQIQSEIKRLMEGKGHQLVGRGSQRIVFDNLAIAKGFLPFNKKWWLSLLEKQEQDHVVAIDYITPKSAIEAKKLFYLHRILYTLFPYNFPKILVSFGFLNEDITKMSGTIREKIVESREPSQKREFPFTLVTKAIKTMNLPILIDSADVNFVLASDGGEYYIDTVMLWNSRDESGNLIVDWNVKGLHTFMEAHNYSIHSIRTVSHAIKRINELQMSLN